MKNAKTDVERNYINRVKAVNDAPEPKNSNEKFFFLPFQNSADFKQLKLAETSLPDYYFRLNSPEYIAQNHYDNDNHPALSFGENDDYVGAEYVDLW